MPHGLPLFSRFLNSPSSSVGNERLDHHLVAAHVHDVVDVLDVDGALLDARAARRARPQHVGSMTPRRRSTRPDERALGLGAYGRPAASARCLARRRRSRYGALANTWSRRSITSSLGDNGFSVFQAGHCDWQRPHSVQVAKSSRPFQVKSSILPRPKTSSSPGSSKSMSVVPEYIGSSGPSALGAPGERDVERRQEDVQVLAVDDDARGSRGRRRCCSRSPTVSMHLVGARARSAASRRPPSSRRTRRSSGRGSRRC